MTWQESQIWHEMARRKKRFHATEDWQSIRLWGLFRWGEVSKLLKKGLLFAPGYSRDNKVIWCFPSPEAYHEYIEPLLDLPIDELTRKAGW